MPIKRHPQAVDQDPRLALGNAVDAMARARHGIRFACYPTAMHKARGRALRHLSTPLQRITDTNDSWHHTRPLVMSFTSMRR
jgi:hypothetical protein